IRLQAEAEAGAAEKKGKQVGTHVDAVEAKLRHRFRAGGGRMEAHVPGPQAEEAVATGGADGQVGSRASRFGLDATRHGLVGKRDHEEKKERENREGGNEAAAKLLQAFRSRESGERQAACHALTVMVTSSVSLFSCDLRRRSLRTRTTPGLRSMACSNRVSLSSGTLPSDTSTLLSRGRPFWPPLTIPRSAMLPMSTPSCRARPST